VGIAAAAAGTLEQLTRELPRAVILVGTCGAYPGSGKRVAEVAVASGTRVVSTAAVLGRGFIPDPVVPRFVANMEITSQLARVAASAPIEVATTLAITTDPELAAVVGTKGGCGVEHLETYGVAAACERLRIPWGAVLGIANEVGPQAHQQWLAHHAETGAIACDVVLSWLEEGAPGLLA
jgi:nucleoside phosphorylase